MNGPTNLARMKAVLTLALFGSMIGYLAPAYCEAQRSSDRGTIRQATTPTWVQTGNLNVARDGHTAILLPNGKVLVVGGRANDILNSAEVYDPTIGTWSIANAMTTPRVGNTATLLFDGKVLVAGGDTTQGYATPDFGRTSTVELYDPGTGTWRFTGNMAAMRSWHTATLLQNGKVLVAGGFYFDTLGTAELYDPVTGSWGPTGPLKVARYGHTATLLQDGRVLVAGGSNDGDLASTLADAELYDPVAGTWSTTANLNTPVVLHTATLLRTGKVLLVGGYMPRFPPRYAGPISLSSAELYDPTAGTWSNTANLNASRDSHSATLLPDGGVLIAGGYDWNSRLDLRSAERYDANKGIWTNTGNLKATRGRHTATLLVDGRVLVAGGATFSNTALNSAELYGTIVPPGTIGPGFTGAWYDPAQSGHGIFLEILSDSRFYAAWFTFNPAGTQQAWFTGVGTYSGNTATISAVEQPSGGRWIPNFVPSQIVRNAWGTLSFTFTDCNHGRVDFNSALGYGAGSMNLTRLTQPAGLSCP